MPTITFTPDLRFALDDQNRSKPFTLKRSTDWTDVASAPGGEGGGIAFYVGGFKVQTGTPPAPARIDWQVFAGAPCMADDEPVAEGSTFIPALNSLNERSGLLFQIAGRRAGIWYLRARLPLGAAGSTYTVGGSVAFEAVTSPAAVGDLVVLAGPVIG